ncbi:MAG TPA: ribbon-helix-helix protein, CopG family [Thermodesulfobacteriota bacterium]|nr:ribbon-helix-helix protein, CopG family [Thermodesulfobacteriota bacterium]
MEKLLNLRISNELMQALEETKWTLRKSMAEVIREAITEYMEKHLPKDALEKVRKMLEKAPEEIKPKKKGR